MSKALFRYWVDESVIAIEDTGQGLNLPVTLDAERVLQTIDEAIGPLVGKYVICADRDGIWTGLTCSKGSKLSVYHLGAMSYSEAKKALDSLSQAKRERYRFEDYSPKGRCLQDWSPDA